MSTKFTKPNFSIIGTCPIAIATLFLSGCAPITYRGAFNEYGEVYADSQNHQMLLNLARLSQHAPPYFFQSGNIQANYTFSGGVSATAGQTPGSAYLGPYNWLWNSLSMTGTRESQPTFNFVPLVGGEFAAHLITPTPPDAFEAFFREGFPVDILMRSLIQQVQFTVGQTNFTLNNSPTVDNVTNYAEFLRLCDMLRDLQDRGDLHLAEYETSTNTFQPVMDFTNDLVTNLDAQLILSTTSQGYHWKHLNRGWSVERELPRTNAVSFEITQDGVSFLEDQIKLPHAPPPYNHPDQVERLIYILQPATKAEPAKAPLRSFLFTLQGMATEQEAFKQLEQNPAFTPNEVPVRQLRPVLQIDWSGDSEPRFHPVVTADYEDEHYEITDPKKEWPDGYNSYNRDAFLLVCTLFSQISLDPTTLNYQQQYLLTR